MQQITVTLTSSEGVVARQVLVKPEGKPVQLNVSAGTKIDVQVQGPVQGKEAKVGDKQNLQIKQVGKNLVIEGADEALVEVADFYEAPNTTLGGVTWDYAEPVASTATQSVEGQAAAEGAAAAVSEGFAGMSLPVSLGVGALGVAALAGGGGGAATSSVPSNVVSGTFVAGPAAEGHNLVVRLYKTDGTTLLGQGVVDANGKFSVNVGSYTGAIVAQLVGKGGGADYRDEATGLDVDLTVDLLAVGSVGGGTNIININPLSTMAAKVAGVTSSNNILNASAYIAAKAATANTEVAKAFGLTGDVTKLDSTPVINADSTPNAAASDLGKVLAALSGLDLQNGGLEQTISKYVPTVGADVDVGATPKADLIAGAATAQAALAAKGITTLVKDVATFVAAASSTGGYSIDAVTGDDMIDATERDAFADLTSTITFKVPSTVTPQSAATDLEVWLLGSNAKGAGNITVDNGVATYTFGLGDAAAIKALPDGPKTVQIKVAAGAATDAGKVLAERLVMLNAIDDAATGISLVNQLAQLDENTPTTAGKKVADIVVKDPDGGAAPALSTLLLDGSDSTKFEIKQTTTGKFELWLIAGETLDYETLKSLSTTVTLGATPAQTYKLAIANVNEAPTGGASIAAQTAVVNQNVWSLDLSKYFTDVDVDAGDALTYSLTSGTLPAGLTLANGVISGTPTSTTQSTLHFTVKATDKGGLSITQDFDLDVVKAPVVKSFTVTDASNSNGTTLGKYGEALTFKVTLSESVSTTGDLTAVFTVGNTDLTLTAAAVSGTDTITFTGANVPDTVSGTFTLKSLTGAQTITGDTSRQAFVAPTAGAIGDANYKVDNTDPTVNTTTFSVAEKATAFTGGGALTASETVTWSLGTGADTALFSLGGTNGNVLSLAAAKDYEADARSYTVNVVATDAAGNATTQDVTVNLTDVNEAPVVTTTAISDVPAVTDTAYTTSSPLFDIHSYFTDPENAALTYSLATGAPSWLNIDSTSGKLWGTAPATAAADLAVTVNVTDGTNTVSKSFKIDVVSKPVISSSLDNVANFDVRSDIVLTATENVTGVAGKKIHLINDGGAGYDGENTVHSYDIDAADTTQVTIVGNKITLNPTWDLDLANDYHIEIDDGAFEGVTSNMDSVAITGNTALNFSTVSPFVWVDDSNLGQVQSTSIASATASVKMIAGTDRADVASGFWFSLMGVADGTPAGIGDTSNANSAALSLAGKDYVILMGRDTLQTPSDPVAQDPGISLPFTTWVKLSNFGKGDSIYIDDQFNSAAATNDIEANAAAVQQPSGTTNLTQISVGASNGQGAVDIAFASEVYTANTANPTNSTTFNTLADFKTYTNSQAVIVG